MDYSSYSNKGGRQINEDSFIALKNAWVVCDGLGGHDSGEVASKCAVEIMEKCCSENSRFDAELINSFYLKANEAIIALKEQCLTTIVGGFLSGRYFYYQNVGDSRLYFFRDKKIYAQTKDDSVCQAAVEMGTMTYDDIRKSEDRSSLLKVLGTEPELKIIRRYEPITIKKGDAFLVCSDGFWEHVLDEEMESSLKEAKSANEWMDRMLKIQYERAKNNDDNYTVVCGIIGDEDILTKKEKKGLFSFLRKVRGAKV